MKAFKESRNVPLAVSKPRADILILYFPSFLLNPEILILECNHLLIQQTCV